MDLNLLDKCGEDMLSHIHIESEKLLSSIRDATQIVHDKSIKFIQLLLGVELALFGFFINDLSKNGITLYSFLSSLLLVIFGISIYYFYKNIEIVKSPMIGRSPSDFLINEIVIAELEEFEEFEKNTFLEAKMSSIENLQISIIKAEKVHLKKVDTFNTATIFLFYWLTVFALTLPILFLAYYILEYYCLCYYPFFSL